MPAHAEAQAAARKVARKPGREHGRSAFVGDTKMLGSRLDDAARRPLQSAVVGVGLARGPIARAVDPRHDDLVCRVFADVQNPRFNLDGVAVVVDKSGFA